MGYMWAYASAISAHPVFRQIPLEDVNALVPSLKKSLYEMAEVLRKANAIMAVLRCPADAVFTDVQGRQTGIVDGQVVNEIPVEVLADGEVEICHAPGRGQAILLIDATDQGMVDLDVIRTEDESAGITSFQDMAVQTGVADDRHNSGRRRDLKPAVRPESIPPSLDTTVDLSGCWRGLR